MGFLCSLFSPRKKKENPDEYPSMQQTRLNPTARPCPPPRGTAATMAILNGFPGALNDLLSAQRYESWRARSHETPIAEPKPYSIQPCAYPETKRWVLNSETDGEESLRLILDVRDRAAERGSSRDLVRFGYAIVHEPNAPKIPRFEKLDDAFVPLFKLINQGMSLTSPLASEGGIVKVDGQSEAWSLTTFVEESDEEFEKQGKDEYVEALHVRPRSRRSLYSSSDEDSSAEEADSDDTYDTDDVDSDTYSLHAELGVARPLRIVRKAQQVNLRVIYHSNNQKDKVSDPAYPDAEVEIAEPLKRHKVHETEPRLHPQTSSQRARGSSRHRGDKVRHRGSNYLTVRHASPPPSPPPSPPSSPPPPPPPLTPLHVKRGKYHYTSPEGILRLSYIKSYLSLPPSLSAAGLILGLLTRHQTVALHAARANPALLRANDELDFSGILAGAESLRFPPGRDVRDMTRRQQAAYWNAESVRLFLNEGGSNLFRGLPEGERTRRTTRRDQHGGLRGGVDFEEEARAWREMPGRVFAIAEARRKGRRGKRGRRLRGWRARRSRALAWTDPGPSYLSVVTGVDEIDG